MEIDPELISACLKRERKAEYEMYKKLYKYLMSICIRYTRHEDAAKDALNIGFVKIFGQLKKYKSEVPFKKWARKIMINTLIDEFRKKKRLDKHIEFVEEYTETINFSEVSNAISEMNAKQIGSLLDKLPETTKEVFNLYVIDGYSHKEIGEMIGFTEGNSKWHLSIGKKMLRELITETDLSEKIKP